METATSYYIPLDPTVNEINIAGKTYLAWHEGRSFYLKALHTGAVRRFRYSEQLNDFVTALRWRICTRGWVAYWLMRVIAAMTLTPPQPSAPARMSGSPSDDFNAKLVARFGERGRAAIQPYASVAAANDEGRQENVIPVSDKPRMVDLSIGLQFSTCFIGEASATVSPANLPDIPLRGTGYAGIAYRKVAMQWQFLSATQGNVWFPVKNGSLCKQLDEAARLMGEAA